MFGTVWIIQSELRDVVEFSYREVGNHVSRVALNLLETRFLNAVIEIAQKHALIKTDKTDKNSLKREKFK